MTHCLQIVIGSTRPGRVGPAIAHWFADIATADQRFTVEVIDLAEVALPMLDEPHHPRLHRYTHSHTVLWSETVERGDAYVFVSPEYNYAPNAATKNALDYLCQEWAGKPLGIVSYGGASGGLRAAQVLKQIGSALRMLTMPDIVAIPHVRSWVDDAGRITPADGFDSAARVLLDEIARLVSRGSSRHRVGTDAGTNAMNRRGLDSALENSDR